jgi:outer membrane protein assembly factor BamB
MALMGAGAAWAADWPQWRGPKRDGVSSETGLQKSWSGTPKSLWQVKTLGEGYGSLAVLNGRLYVQGAQEGRSTVFCLNAADGKTLWSTPIGPRLDQDRGPGVRSTPTIDGDRLYALTENGDLACLNLADGKARWSKNILKEYKGSNPYWLISESPLVDGDRLIVTPGGRGAGVVALNKMTGMWIWSCKELNDSAGYSSCVVADIGNVRTIMTLTSQAGVGIRANDGKLMWRWERPANGTANCTTPVYADNKVFYTSAYGTGGSLMQLTPKGDVVEAKEVYFTRDMQNHHGGVVLVNGHLYGFSNAILTCLEFATGTVKWKNRSVGKGSLTAADGLLFLLSETNVAGLAEASPQEYRERGRFRIDDSGWPSWAYPVVANGRLYLRNQASLTCYDVKA